MPRSARILLALLPIVGGCTKTESGLKQRAERVEAEAEAEAAPKPEPVAPSTPLLPTSLATPEEMEPERWADLHWLPPTIVGINGTPPDALPLLLQWVYSQPGSDHPACKTVERGLRGGYGIEWEEPPQSFILFGEVALELVGQCAVAVLEPLGGTATMTKEGLRLEAFGKETLVRFARRGEQLVAIVDDGRLGSIAAAEPDRLAGNEALVTLLTGAVPSIAVWSASTRDLATPLLGVPSLGYTLHVVDGGRDIRLRVEFSSEAEAERARTATGPVIREAEALLGVPVETSIERLDETLLIEVDLTAAAALSDEELQAAMARLAARLATAAPAAPPQ